MTAYKGALMLIKIGDGELIESFATVGGLRSTRMSLNNQLLDNSDMESGQWQSLAAAGLKSVSIRGGGIFVDAASEELMRNQAFSSAISNYQLELPKGDWLQGAFYISQYERSADYDDVELYSMTLLSAGPISYHNAE